MATATRSIDRLVFASRTEPLTRTHWTAVALASATGLVHVYLYVAQGYLPFLLAGVAFFTAVAFLLAGLNRRVLYAIGAPFTASQIAIWYVQGMPEFLLGVADKAVQAALLALLVYLFVTERVTTRERNATGEVVR